MSWLTNWNYRKSIAVSNTGSTLTDYQVQITIDTATLVTATKMLSTCDDIRFTLSDGSTLLNYWIESGQNTSSTKIWVKIPSIANGNNTIYLYYGNAGASSGSSTTGTFIREITNVAGAWKFDEQTGTLVDDSGNNNNGTSYSLNLNDLSGNNNHGTITGATRVAGKLGQALSFNGSGNYVNCGNDASLNITGAITIEAWVKLTSNTFQPIVSKYEETLSQESYSFGLSGNKLQTRVSPNGSTPYIFTGVATLNNNQWYHLVMTYDGSNIKQYYDGNLDKTDAYSLSLYTSSSTVQIGRWGLTPTMFFNGLIDDVRIYNRALSPSEITAHYNSGNGLISDPSTETGLAGYWRMGTTDGMTVPGKFNNALKLDGIDDYINFGNGASLGITSAITIEGWIKLTALPIGSNYATIFDKPYTSHVAPYYNYEMRVLSSGVVDVVMVVGSYDVDYVTSTTVLSAGLWYHIASTFDGTTLRLYINSTPDGSLNNPGTIINSNMPLNMGRRQNLNDCYFNGLFDNMHIYNRALTQAEITDLYNNYGYTTANYANKELVRKYAFPEPTFSVAGTEEIGVTIPAATGGTETTTATHRIHTFTSSGSFIANKAMNVEYLVVAGGGGGGGEVSSATIGAGGGGAGGLLTNVGGAGLAVTTQSYIITVGNGGAGGAINSVGISGLNSSFGSLITSTGGGGGGLDGVVGLNGGSGGGGGRITMTAGTGTFGQGYNGGAGGPGATDSGGGGGGAGAVGGANGGNGGVGLSNSISGVAAYYAGGGGAGKTGTGGLGGGGNGGSNSDGYAATPNTGGGGGGAGVSNNGKVGGAGGSGIVIIRYLLSEDLIPANITATTMTITPTETPCRVGLCTVNVSVTWTNNGGSEGSFVPNITIDGSPITPIYPLQSLAKDASATKGFVITDLPAGSHPICPDPN